MTDHLQRFSMPPPGFTVASKSAAPSSFGFPQSSQASPVTLAQIYAEARQQAVATVQRRQWDSLLDQLFNS